MPAGVEVERVWALWWAPRAGGRSACPEARYLWKGVGLGAVVGTPAESRGTCQIRQRCLPQSEALSEAQRGWYLPPVPAPPLAGPRAVVGAS